MIGSYLAKCEKPARVIQVEMVEYKPGIQGKGIRQRVHWKLTRVWLLFKAMGLDEITQGRSTGGKEVRGQPEPIQYVWEKKRSHKGGKKSPFFNESNILSLLLRMITF